MKLIDYSLSATTDIDTLKSRLGRLFTALKETTEETTVDLYDTFDWRMHQNGWHLFRSSGHFTIVHAATGRLISEIHVDGKKARRFIWDFPASDFGAHLAPVLEMRAILRVATIEKKVDQLSVCNADEKIVARIEIESLTVDGSEHAVTHCRLQPVRGYGKESRAVITLLEKMELEQKKVSPVEDLLRQCGIEPGAYSSKVKVSLAPQMPAATAIQAIMKNLVGVMHQNLDGVRNDIDTEFLHDFRVAVRRARSLLSQTKGVLSPEITAGLQAHLKAIGAMTGDVRDLDVYLLKKTTYLGYVPEVLKPGILQLFRVLQRKRRTARDRMCKAMAGEQFEAALAALDGFIQADPMACGDRSANIPIGQLAKTVIFKRYRQIMKKGGRISAGTPDERLHELRIDCKKLRYLLEFFTSLFPDDQMKLLIKQLKRLQENLGDFNDLSIQQAFMASHLETIDARTSRAVILAAAAGGLITRLDMHQEGVRSDFLNVFEAFGAHENRARFKALFT